MENYQATLLSQYADAPTLVQMVRNFNNWIDPARNIDAFYTCVWNVATATGWGLDVWGRIVGVSRILEVSTGKFLGFDEATPISADPFGQSPLYAGMPLTSNYLLSDDAYRVLILAKAMTNICDGSIPAINQVLLNLFPGRGACYVTDGEDMTMTYAFAFVLSPVEVAIVSSSGVLPKPVGVTATVVQV